MEHEMLQVIVSFGDATGETRLTVDPEQCVAEAEAFECKAAAVQRVLFGDADVLKDESFEDHGIEVRAVCVVVLCFVPVLITHLSDHALSVLGHQDGARLSVSIKTWKASVAEVAAELVANNPGALDSAVLLSRSRC